MFKVFICFWYKLTTSTLSGWAMILTDAKIVLKLWKKVLNCDWYHSVLAKIALQSLQHQEYWLVLFWPGIFLSPLNVHKSWWIWDESFLTIHKIKCLLSSARRWIKLFCHCHNLMADAHFWGDNYLLFAPTSDTPQYPCNPFDLVIQYSSSYTCRQGIQLIVWWSFSSVHSF